MRGPEPGSLVEAFAKRNPHEVRWDVDHRRSLWHHDGSVPAPGIGYQHLFFGEPSCRGCLHASNPICARGHRLDFHRYRGLERGSSLTNEQAFAVARLAFDVLEQALVYWTGHLIGYRVSADQLVRLDVVSIAEHGDILRSVPPPTSDVVGFVRPTNRVNFVGPSSSVGIYEWVPSGNGGSSAVARALPHYVDRIWNDERGLLLAG